MARKDSIDEVEVVVDETEEVLEGDEVAAPKAKKAPARGELPEEYVTPVGFAKIVSERELHTDRNGGHDVKPQMVYSYIKNAPKEDPFPLTDVEDSLGKTRSAVLIEDGIAWWERKNERTSARKVNAAEKAAAKEKRAAEKAAAAEAEGEVAEESDLTEAE